METTLTSELLQNAVDHALLDVMPKVGGITLLRGDSPPSGELYTVYTIFDGEMPVNLALCGNAATFTHLTQHMMGQDEIEPEDLADAAKEFFNVLCGHVAIELFHATNLALRFQIPRFGGGIQIPEGHTWQFVLNYSGDKDESMQVIQHTGVTSGVRDRTQI